MTDNTQTNITNEASIEKPNVQSLPIGVNKELYNKCYDQEQVLRIHILNKPACLFQKSKLPNTPNNIMKNCMFLEYKKYETLPIQVNYKYVSENIVDVDRWDNPNIKRTKGWINKDSVGYHMANYLLKEYNGSVPPFTAYTENGAKYFSVKQTVITWECGRPECGLIESENEEITFYKSDKTIRCAKAICKLSNADIKACKQKLETDPNTQDELIVNGEVIFPRWCLHEAYFDEVTQNIQPTAKYYGQRHNSQIRHTSDKTRTIQIQQLKQIDEELKKHGNLRGVGSVNGIKKWKEREKKKNAGVKSNNLNQEINDKIMEYYNENMLSFNRNEFNVKQKQLNREDRDALNTLHVNPTIPVYFQVAPPKTIKPVIKEVKKKTIPPIAYTDWTGNELQGFKREQILNTSDNTLVAFNKINKMKTLYTATDYKSTDAGGNGGGNAVLSSTAAEVGTLQIVKKSFNVLQEKFKRLHGINYYDVFGAFMSDRDLTIVMAHIQLLHGDPMTLIKYLNMLWKIIQDGNLREKLYDIMICISHHHRSIPRKILGNYKGSGTSRIKITKRIISTLNVWKYVEALEWNEDCLENCYVCVSIIKALIWLYKSRDIMKYCEMQNFAICADDGNPFDEIEHLQQKLDYEIEKEEDKSSKSAQIKSLLKFIESQEALEIDTGSNATNRYIDCDGCENIFKAPIDDNITREFCLIRCPHCHTNNPHWIGESETLYEVPLYKGPTVSHQQFSTITISKKSNDEVSVYWDIAGVSLADNSTNPWFTDKEDSTLTAFMLIPMIAPCFRKKIYSTADNRNRKFKTSAAIECTIKDKKSPKIKSPILQWIDNTNNWMMGKIETWDQFEHVPKQQKREKCQLETSWASSKDMQRDNELEDLMESFMGRFRIDTIKDAIHMLSEQLQCDINARWYATQINKKNLNDPRRIQVISMITQLIKKKKRKISNNLTQINAPKFVTVDMKQQISNFYFNNNSNLSPNPNHVIRVYRETLEHNGYHIHLKLSKMPPTSQTIPANFGAACGLCSINNSKIAEEYWSLLAYIAKELTETQDINALNANNFTDNCIRSMSMVFEDILDTQELIKLGENANAFLLELMTNLTVAEKTRYVNNLLCIQNMASLDMELCAEEFATDQHIIIMEHLKQVGEGIEDFSVMEKFFKDIFDYFDRRGVSKSFSMNTKEWGFHWLTGILINAVKEYNIFILDSLDSPRKDVEHIKLMKGWFELFIIAFGYFTDENLSSIKKINSALLSLKQNLNSIDYKHEDMHQLFGDDMNQIINHPNDWKQYMVEVDMECLVFEDMRNKIMEICQFECAPFDDENIILRYYLSKPYDCKSFQIALNFVKAKYVTLRNMNSAWNLNISRWKQLKTKNQNIDVNCSNYTTDNEEFLGTLNTTIESKDYIRIFGSLDSQFQNIIKNKCLSMIQRRVNEIDFDSLIIAVGNYFSANSAERVMDLFNDIRTFILEQSQMNDTMFCADDDFYDFVVTYRQNINITFTDLKTNAYDEGFQKLSEELEDGSN
eukprot:30503_1